MTVSLLSGAVAGLLLLQLSIAVVLRVLNVRAARTQRGQVPVELAGQVPREIHDRSIDYAIARASFGVVRSCFDIGVVLAVLATGLLGKVDEWLALLMLPPYWHSVSYLVLLAAGSSLLELPLSWYASFRLEERFGFNTRTPRVWISDQAKNVMLTSLLILVLSMGVLLLLELAGARWWIFAFLFVFCVQLAIVIAYPRWIAPLFNSFRKLDDPNLASRIEALSRAAGFPAREIYVMDGSRRSKHGNAYLVSFGRSRRIVLFDTLLESLSGDGVLAVVAHELGHATLRHVHKNLVLVALSTLVAFVAADVVLHFDALHRAFGLKATTPHGALAIFAIISAPFSFLASPVVNFVSRHFEYEADRFAARLQGEGQSLSEALLGLSRQNLATVEPHPAFRWFSYSHPTLLQRLRALREVKYGNG